MVSDLLDGAAMSDRQWFGPVPRGADWNPQHGADPDAVDFHRHAAGDPERIDMERVGTLTRINRQRERRT